MKCPICTEGTIINRHKQYICNFCGFYIPKEMSGRVIELETVKTLIQNKKTELLTGFVSQKNDKTFSAYLKLRGNKIIYEFPDDSGSPDEVKIQINSLNSGTVLIKTSGTHSTDKIISYGNIPARQAECLALLTVLFVLRRKCLLSKVQVNIEIGNPDAALYVLKEKTPRENHFREIVDIIQERLCESKGWQVVHIKPPRGMRIAGSSQTDIFPTNILEDMEVTVEKKPGFLIVSLPQDRLDIHAQFEASISTAKKVADEAGKYYVQRFAEKRLFAWIAAAKGGTK